jgi:hypothetical protein
MEGWCSALEAPTSTTQAEAKGHEEECSRARIRLAMAEVQTFVPCPVASLRGLFSREQSRGSNRRASHPEAKGQARPEV